MYIADLSPLASLVALKDLSLEMNLQAGAGDIRHQSDEVVAAIGMLTTLVELDTSGLARVCLAEFNGLLQLQQLVLRNIADLGFGGCTLDWTRLLHVRFQDVMMGIDRVNNAALQALQQSGVFYTYRRGGA